MKNVVVENLKALHANQKAKIYYLFYVKKKTIKLNANSIRIINLYQRIWFSQLENGTCGLNNFVYIQISILLWK